MTVFAAIQLFLASRRIRLLSSKEAKCDDQPERRHGNDGVPERLRDAGELCSGDVLLRVKYDRSEDDDCHCQREQQETELAGARLQRIAKDPQTQKLHSKTLRITIPIHVSGKEDILRISRP